MKRTKIILLALLVLCVSSLGALAQNAYIVKKDLSQVRLTDRKDLQTNETQFRRAVF
jgi:hypothetical protein